MINAIILREHQTAPPAVINAISKSCPELNLSASVYSGESDLLKIVNSYPALLFLDIENGITAYEGLFRHLDAYACETILISSKRDYIFDAIKYKISGYLLKPLNPNSLKNTVKTAVGRITNKIMSLAGSQGMNDIDKSGAHPKRSLPDSVLGIPTMEGYEFLTVKDIIRCESYQKCTRVITINRSDVISSYNIGEFYKSLAEHGFFAPHQSHLINLTKIKKYLKEGTIIMRDDSAVPVSRRRRTEFLDQVQHL